MAGPIVICAALLRTKDFRLASSDEGGDLFSRGGRADRDHLIAPPMWLESLDELEPSIQSLLNVLFQGYGAPMCPYYDPTIPEFQPPRL